jgi:hypothetical protein
VDTSLVIANSSADAIDPVISWDSVSKRGSPLRRDLDPQRLTQRFATLQLGRRRFVHRNINEWRALQLPLQSAGEPQPPGRRVLPEIVTVWFVKVKRKSPLVASHRLDPGVQNGNILVHTQRFIALAAIVQKACLENLAAPRYRGREP